MKQSSLIFAATILGACAVSDKPAESALCNLQVTKTSAWVNMMPGPGGPPGNLTVMVEVREDGISRRLAPRSSTSGHTLELDIVEWGPEAGLDKIVYRSRSQRPPERVEIFCNGHPVKSIEDVTIAQ